MSVPQDEQTFLIKFNLINELCLAVRVGSDAECHMITTEPMVLEICFDIQVLWIISMFPEQTVLANQVYCILLGIFASRRDVLNYVSVF